MLLSPCIKRAMVLSPSHRPLIIFGKHTSYKPNGADYIRIHYACLNRFTTFGRQSAGQKLQPQDMSLTSEHCTYLATVGCIPRLAKYHMGAMIPTPN